MARCSSPDRACSDRRRIATRPSPCCAQAVASGVDHIDTSDFYGPHVTNQLIREALHPYPDDLVIVTKVGAVRGADASWNAGDGARGPDPRGPRQSAQPRRRRARRRQPAGDGAGSRAERRIDRGAVHRARGTAAPRPDPPSRPQQRHLRAGRRRRAASPRWSACRTSTTSPIATTTPWSTSLRPWASPMCPSSPSAASRRCNPRPFPTWRGELGATPMQVALAWLLHRAPNILLIPGTSSLGHLRENLQAAELKLSRRRARPAGRDRRKDRSMSAIACHG